MPYDLDMYAAMGLSPAYQSPMVMPPGAGFGPLATGQRPRLPTGFEGLPFPGMGGFGPVAELAAQGVLQSQMNQMGMVPMGVGHDIGVYDNIRAMQYMQSRNEAMQLGAQADRSNFMRTARGKDAVFGLPWTQERQKAAGTFADAYAWAAPMAAQMFPEQVDEFGGKRGSATVMAMKMSDAGRYRIDPVSGQLGMSGQSVGAATQMLFRDLYSDQNIAQMRGLKAGQVGDMYNELQMRGMIRSSALEPEGQRGDFRRAAHALTMDELGQAARRQNVDISRGVDRLSGGDLDKLGNDTALADQVRAIDTSRIKRSLQGYTSAVAAMREIFGDANMPNAPMQQLVATLDQFTGSAMGQINPQKIAGMARQTWNLAKQGGVGFDQLQAMHADISGRAKMMGLDPMFGVEAMQGGMAFGNSFRAAGMSAIPQWGAMNDREMQKLDENLRLQAAASPVSNRLGLMMRLDKAHGGFKAGSEAAAIVQSINLGLNQYRDANGNLQSMALSESTVMRALGGARGASGQLLGTSNNDILAMLNEKSVNQEHVFGTQINDITRRAQGGEIGEWGAGRTNMVLRQRLRGLGLEDTEARKIAGSVSRSAFQKMMQMSDDEYSNAESRAKGYGEILSKSLAGTAAGAKLNAMSPDERAAWLTTSGTRLSGDADTALTQSQFRGMKTMGNVRRVMNETLMNMSDAQKAKAAQDALVQDSMSPLGKGTALSRIMDAVQGVDMTDPNAVARAVSIASGGVSKADVAQALTAPMQAVINQRKAVEDLQQRVRASTKPEERAQLQRQLEAAQKQLVGATTSLTTVGEKYGASGGTGQPLYDVATGAVRAGREMAAQLDKMGPKEVNQGELSSMLKSMGGFIGDERRADFLKDRPDLKNAPQHLVDRALLESQVLKDRGKNFWKSDEGETFRSSTDAFTKNMAATATMILADKSVVRRLGTRAIDVHRELVGGAARLEELAEKHAGGDMAKLMTGEFTFDMSTPAGKELAGRVRSETFNLRRRQLEIADTVFSKMPKRHERAEAMKLMGIQSENGLDPATRKQLDQMTGDVKLARSLSADDITKYRTGDAGMRHAISWGSGLRGEMAPLDRAINVTERLEAMRSKAEGAASASGGEVASTLLKSFGIDKKASDIDPALASLLGSARGKGMANRLLTSQTMLTTVAMRGGDASNTGINAMVGQYQAALSNTGPSRQKAINEFYGKYKFDMKEGVLTEAGAQQMGEFAQAIELQKRSKFLQFGKGRGMSTDVEAGGILGTALGEGKLPARGGSEAGPVAMRGTIDGTLTIVGDKATVAGTMGGTRGATATT